MFCAGLREHADRTGREAVMFSSILRARGLIGTGRPDPPLAYALATGFSFYGDVL